MKYTSKNDFTENSMKSDNEYKSNELKDNSKLGFWEVNYSKNRWIEIWQLSS